MSSLPWVRHEENYGRRFYILITGEDRKYRLLIYNGHQLIHAADADGYLALKRLKNQIKRFKEGKLAEFFEAV